jgi:hypothetical protein
LIKETKETNKRNLSVEEITKATRKAPREEATLTRKRSKDRLQRIKRHM